MPSDAQLLKVAVDRHRAGDIGGAAQSYREILHFNPANADALHLLGVACHQRGEHSTAIEFISRAILQAPTNPAFHSNLGAAYRSAGRLNDAIRSFQQALELNPNYDDALYNLANSFRALGRLNDAANCYSKYLGRHPQNADALVALATLRRSQQRTAEAIEYLQKVVAIAPDRWEAANDLGSLLKEAGRLIEAAEVLGSLVTRKHDSAIAHHNLANVQRELKQFTPAVASYEKSLELDPTDASVHSNLAMTLQEMGETSEAARRQLRAVALNPTAQRRIRLAMLLPPIYQSVAEIESWRDRLETEVDYLIEQEVTIDPSREMVTPNFHLAYQGRDDRRLQEKIGRLYRSTFDRRSQPHNVRCDDRIHVGFVSHYLKEHTIGRLFGGVINGLSRERFHVSVFSHGRHDDSIADEIRRHANDYVVLPRQLQAACEEIARRNLDLLFYCDIGMDPFTTSLAHSRLARVQATTWGHPVTTGIECLDYFVSSALFEPENAANHYSERLALLQTTGIVYRQPVVTRAATRASFALPEDRMLYACPQSLFKLHPEFDRLIGEILRRDQRGIVVLLSGHCEHWNRLLRKRFSQSIPDVAERVHFLPRMSYDDFLAVQQTFDVILDPPHFCGGNTSCEALSFGTPIVTWPSPFLRGRLTYGLFQEMKCFETVAKSDSEYVDLAVQLGTDNAWRHHVRERILATNECLFDDHRVAKDMERLFEEMLQGSQRQGADRELARDGHELQIGSIQCTASATELLDRGNALKLQDEIPAAVRCFRRSLGARADEPLRRLWLASLFPAVWENVDEIEQYRERLDSTLAEVLEAGLSLNVADIDSRAFPPPFELLHHGRDNRPLKEAFARALAKSLQPDAPRHGAGKPKVGIVVTGGHERVFARCLAGMINRMNSSAFEVHIVCTAAGRKILASQFERETAKLLVVPPDFQGTLELVRSGRFDVLWYWEVGSDVANYFLPFLRPASLQCVSWGVPDTTGISEMDYFLSSKNVETENADRHYSERLIRANVLLTWQDRIAFSGPRRSRESFGLSASENLYLCVQQIRKLHPDFDLLIAGILQRDAKARVAIVADARPEIIEKLRRRIARTTQKDSQRITFLNRLAYRDYFDLIAAADVMLDTPHFGAGITAYDAFALGKPLVTLPGPFRRSRYATACYRQMGIDDCIAKSADDYIEIATRIGSNRDDRAVVEDRIRFGGQQIFENQTAVNACRQILEHLVAEARRF